MALRKGLAGLVGLMGLVFFLQGTGLFTAMESAMNYDVRWAVVGIALFIVAIGLWSWGPREN